MRKQTNQCLFFMVKKEVFEGGLPTDRQKEGSCGEFHQDTKVYMKPKISVGQGKDNDSRDNPSKNARKSA